MMKSRIDIKGRKIWVDNDNMYSTRPPSTEIILLRDGEIYKTTTVKSTGDGAYTFACLPVWQNSSHKYAYRVDEQEVPIGYSKTIQEYNITNTINTTTISGIKTWVDNNNEEGYRPSSITVHILQNGIVVNSIEVLSPPDVEDTAQFTFGEMPFANSQSIPYIYTIDEDDIENYAKTVNGFNITNTVQNPTPFSFTKNSVRTAMALQGAEFEIRQNGQLIETAVSDPNGIVSFLIPGHGTFQMMETQPPVGYMSDVIIYEVVVASDGTVTVDGQLAAGFGIQNQPMAYDMDLSRATAYTPTYMAAPNAWPLHGTSGTDLYMVDKIYVTPQVAPVTVKWDYGTRDTAYFSVGGGYDITGSYMNGFPVFTNGIYTVYALFSNGYEVVKTINIDRIRNGSAEMPYLLIDYITAEDLEPSVMGIEQFTLHYMQGGGIKLSQSYELFENMNMTGKQWKPLGTASSSSPYPVSEGFSGSLEGNEHTITGLDLVDNESPNDLKGLFRVVIDGAVLQNFGISYNIVCQVIGGMAGLIKISDGGTVSLKNLHIIDSTIVANSYVGGVVGRVVVSSGFLSIDGCRSANLALDSIRWAGGIIGLISQNAAGTISITNCSSTGTINKSNLTSGAGIVATVSNEGICSITNCVSDMSITGGSNLGGILASTQPSPGGLLTISSCYNHGNIKGFTSCGGIVGDVTSQSTVESFIIKDCYNAGTINKIVASSVSHAGGLIGRSLGVLTLINSYNIGDVIADFDDKGSLYNVRIGGLLGSRSAIQNCAAINFETSGPLSSMARIAPLYDGSGTLGNNVAYGNMRVLINGVQKSPLDIGSSGADGINVSKTEIKTQSLYETDLGWDFDDVWSFGNGAYTLPVLRGIPLDLQPDTLPLHLV